MNVFNRNVYPSVKCRIFIIESLLLNNDFDGLDVNCSQIFIVEKLIENLLLAECF